MLTDTNFKSLKPREKAYKVADRDGMYVSVSPGGSISFRYDYRLNGRRETLTIGRYDAGIGAKRARELGDLDYGLSVSLAEARLLLTKARRSVEQGQSPSRAKVERRAVASEALTFAGWASAYFESANLADSTLAMRKSIYERNLKGPFGKLKLEEITPSMLMALCEKIADPKGRNAPAPAVHAREVVLLVFRYVQARGVKIANPAEAIRPSAIATFKARDRALSPTEIRTFFKALEKVSTLPTLRLAVRFMLLTMARKSEFTGARWSEIDFENATWTIPSERMKAGRPHRVYLSQQAIDILIAFKTCFCASEYVHPGRYESNLPISGATLNRVLDAAQEAIGADGIEFDHLTVHDLRRTASTLLHEAGFNSDWIEKCLAHEQKGVRAVYNKAEYADQRRDMLQQWADMVDAWIADRDVIPVRRQLAA
ncbi:MAG: tyrosine-type recombinase/integrase [Rhizobacter sp.]